MDFYRPTTRPRLYVARATQKPRRARLAWVLLVAALSERMVSVSCTDGSQPSTQKAGDVLLISCGKE